MKTRNMEEEPSSIRMEIDTMAIGLMDHLRVRVE